MILPTYDEYKVIRARHADELGKLVTEATKDGWVVFGSLAVEPNNSTNQASYTTFYQPMIRSKKEGA